MTKRFDAVKLPEYNGATVGAVCDIPATFPVLRNVDFSNTVANRKGLIQIPPVYLYKNVTFYKCDFTNADIQQLTFEDCNFIECVFKNTKFWRTGFGRTRFSSLSFKACQLFDVEFYTCLLDYVTFFDDTEISYLKSISTIFTNSVIDCKFTKCDRFFEKFSQANNQLVDCRLNEEKFRLMGNHVPSDGAFIGWKYGEYFAKDSREPLLECVIKLLIPEDAKRVGAATKCRASKVKVLEIISLETGEKLDYAFAPMYDFRYDVGETYTCEDFDDYAWNICAPGFHFFLDKKDAMAFSKGWT